MCCNHSSRGYGCGSFYNNCVGCGQSRNCGFEQGYKCGFSKGFCKGLAACRSCGCGERNICDNENGGYFDEGCDCDC